MKYLTPMRTLALLVLLSLTSIGAMCDRNKPAERKLLEAEDTAAEVISKMEKVRTDLLGTPQPIGIDQSTATNIDRWLLRANRNLKRVSVASDRYAANPAVGTGDIAAAISEARLTLDDMKKAVTDGSLGIKNANSQQSVVSLIDALKSVLRTVETAVAEISRRKR